MFYNGNGALVQKATHPFNSDKHMPTNGSPETLLRILFWLPRAISIRGYKRKRGVLFLLPRDCDTRAIWDRSVRRSWGELLFSFCCVTVLGIAYQSVVHCSGPGFRVASGKDDAVLRPDMF